MSMIWCFTSSSKILMLIFADFWILCIVLEVCGGDLESISTFENMKKDDVTFQIVDDSDSEFGFEDDDEDEDDTDFGVDIITDIDDLVDPSVEDDDDDYLV